MKLIHWILSIALYIVSHVSFAQTTVFPDTNFLKQEYARQQAIKAELEKLKAMQLKYQQDKKNTSSEKSILNSLPVHWEERGPTGLPNGINQVLIDANDPTGKKAWAATWGGLWYNNDITADSSWHLTEIVIPVFSIAQNPVNPLEIFFVSISNFYNTFNGGNTWNLGNGTWPTQLKYNNNGDLYSGCFRTCSSENKILKLNRISMVFEEFIDAQYTFLEEINPNIRDIAFDHENKIYLALGSGRIYRSSNSIGGPWTNIMTSQLSSTTFQTNISVGKDLNNNTIIYAINLKRMGNSINNINWFRKSLNGGNTWSNLSIPVFNSLQVIIPEFANLYVSPTNANKIVICGTDLISSNDGGNSWKKSNHWFFNSKTIVSNSVKYFVAAEEEIHELNNLFVPGSISINSRIQDLNTNYTYKLGYRNYYQDSIFFHPKGLLEGQHILKKKGFITSTIFDDHYDNNEPEIHFTFNPFLSYISSNGTHTNLNHINVGNQNGPSCYDERNNVAFGLRFSSQINNETNLFRIKYIGSGREFFENIIIPKYFTILEMKAINDSTLFIVNLNLDNSNYEIFKLIIKPSNSVNYTLLHTNNYIEKITISRTNPDFLLAKINGSLYMSDDGGLIWNNKISSLQGFAINPGNADQLFMVDSYKIYKTDNFTSNSVIWEEITGDLIKIPSSLNKIWYRETDGKLYVSNSFRGIFSTNYFQSSVTDSIIIANYNKEACVNDSIKVSFYKNGAFSETNTYELWISDASGNFTNAIKIGSSSNSPIYGIIPDHLAAGTNYKLKVISTNPSVAIKHADTDLFEVKKGSGMFLFGYPKAINATQNGFVINAPVNQNAEVWYVVTQTGKPRPTISQIRSGIDSSGIAFLVADSVVAQSSISNPIIIAGLMPGNTYDAYVVVKLPTEECFSEIKKVTFSTKGTPAIYCIPQSVNGCSGDNYISEVKVYNYENSQYSVLSNFNSGCGSNSYTFNSQNIEGLIAGINNKTLFHRIHDFQGSFPPRGVALWIDFNEDGDFEDTGELLNSFSVDMNGYGFPFTANSTVSPGIKRMRIRLNSGSEYTFPMSPCATYQYGETEDYLVKVETNEPYIFANLDKDTVGQCEVIKVVMDVTGSYNFGNVFRVELSNPSGNFADSTVILSGLSVDLPVNIQIPHNLPSGDGYKLRVVSTDPVAVSYESAAFTIAPQIQEILSDFSSASHTINQIGTISAKNKNTNSARVNFKAWNSVLLLPNFEAKPSPMGSFKAEIVGCDN